MKNTASRFAVPGFTYGLPDLCALLVDGTSEPLLVVDQHYRILLANPATARWLGLPRPQLLQASLPSHLPAGDRDALLAFLDRGLAGGPDGFAQSFELGGRHLLWTAQGLRDKEGVLHGLLCRITDCTEAEQTRRHLGDLQRALQEKDLLLRSRAQLAGTLLEATPGLTFVLDRALRFCAANRSYLAYTHSKEEDLLGRSLTDCFPDAANTVLPGKIREALEGKQLLLTNVPCVLHEGTCTLQLTPLSYEGFVYGVLVVAEVFSQTGTTPGDARTS